MQVDPIKPTLKGPEIKRLKLQCDGPVSIFAFKSNLRRYTKDAAEAWRNATDDMISADRAAGVHTRPLFGST